nr:ELWxxDGT repeat protein [uncultured Psychroserpens sp.]
MKKNLLYAFLIATYVMQAQVSLVKNISINGDSNPQHFVEYNNALYFQASNNASGNNFELWRTNGTTAGTILVKELRASGSSSPRGFKVFNNLLYFIADGSAISSSLYSTDGTDPGTVIFQTTVYNAEPYFNVLNNELYYSRFYAAGQRALFKYDGTTETQLSPSGASRYSISYESNNRIIFQSNTVAGDYEIWSSDGTSSGTTELADISYGDSGGSDAKDFFEANGNVYFTAYGDAGIGRELYITDGTSPGTVLLKNINPTIAFTNAANSNPNNFTVFNNMLYFTANDAINGDELWMTDGTTAGTQMVLDLYPGATGSIPSDLYVYNNALYFAASHPTLGREVFKCSALNSITNLKNVANGSNSSDPSDFTEYNGKLYFVADNLTNGRELWNTTGFSSTTNLVADINSSGTGSSNPSNLTVFGSNLFFSADDGVTGTGIELYKYRDPTLSVTLSDIDDNLLIFPNPISDDFSIQTNNIIKSIAIYNIQGKLVKSFSNQLDRYNISDLNTGLYFAKIKSNKGELVKKLIKE